MTVSVSTDAYLNELHRRMDSVAQDEGTTSIPAAAKLIVETLRNGGVISAFGTGHSEAMAMEIAGRAGGLIPTNRISLRDLVIYGDYTPESLGGSDLERQSNIARDLYELTPVHPADLFLIASNSGVNGSVVGMAELVKDKGHKLIVVTSMDHTRKVEPKHPSGKRLYEFADVTIDNKAPYGDVTLDLPDGGGIGAVSSITAALVAQFLTIEVTKLLIDSGVMPPTYISANIPGGDEHNTHLERQYLGRIRRDA
ncbi:SIS domain-containing protein [Saxibacter everestensis]|uniref:SIS domain-containing protein n=1 Tax=Saxibacter everestensis TaxID=2909229 RepID=A0ABY8QTL4_9MICO|nr:SIS domain-containing protein [Brevibacteriaceae bacterium ZFBP1038]